VTANVVTRDTAEFVELKVSGSKVYDRIRLYKDKLTMNKVGSKTERIDIAKGKWTE
jgi:hypothetical protein